MENFPLLSVQRVWWICMWKLHQWHQLLANYFTFAVWANMAIGNSDSPGTVFSCESHHVIMSWLSNCTEAKSVIPKIHLWSTRNSPDDYKMELSGLIWGKQSRDGEVLRNSCCTSYIIENKRTLSSDGPWLIKELHFPKSIWVCIWSLKQYSIKKRIHEWCCA